MKKAKIIEISHPTGIIRTNIHLPASKSESNRALIIKALSKKNSTLKNLSQAKDTLILKKIIHSNQKKLNVQDAGTVMRFLTSYFTVTHQKKILYGTPRMHQRPIKPLVDALKKLGADINYIRREGFPPIEIKNFIPTKKNVLSITGAISSQYISSLLMIAPYLPKGLKITITGKKSATPYIKMTTALMAYFGVHVYYKKNKIYIPKSTYQKKTYTIPADWSSAGYWYSIAALSKKATIDLNALHQSSHQADEVVTVLTQKWGITSSSSKNGIRLKKKIATKPSFFTFNFSDCPDLAPTLIVACAALEIPFHGTGLDSLHIKESDRLHALQNELKKIGIKFIPSKNKWITRGKLKLKKSITFDSHQDHRIAMALAPLALLGSIRIKNPSVVTKSYPHFWKDLKKAGFKIRSTQKK